TFLTSAARSEASHTHFKCYGVEYPSLGIPDWVPQLLEAGTWLCGIIMLGYVVRWSLQNRRILPPIVLLPAAAQSVWFVIGVGLPGFVEFVPFFHSLQYLLIAWSMQLQEKLDETGIEPSKRFVLAESARWGLGNIAGGVGLFWALPHSVAAVGYPMELAMPVVLATVQIHHFFVDGVIWKLKNPKVGSPLLVNIHDLLGTAPEPMPPAVSRAA